MTTRTTLPFGTTTRPRITVVEAADLTRLSQSTIRRMIRVGRLAAEKTREGRRTVLYIRPTELRAALDAGDEPHRFLGPGGGSRRRLVRRLAALTEHQLKALVQSYVSEQVQQLRDEVIKIQRYLLAISARLDALEDKS